MDNSRSSLSFKNAPNTSIVFRTVPKTWFNTSNITINTRLHRRYGLRRITIPTSPYKNTLTLTFPKPITSQIIPSDIMLIIGEFAPMQIRLLNNKYLYALENSFDLNYGDELEYYWSRRAYLLAMKIRPNQYSLNYFYRPYNNKYSPCGGITKRGTFCKIVTLGNKRCRYHRGATAYIYDQCITSLELRIDPTDGVAYTRRQFLKFYGNYDMWNSAASYVNWDVLMR